MDGRESLLLAPTERGARARVRGGGVGAWAGTQVCRVCAGASRLTMMVPRQGVQALSVVPHEVRVGGRACAGWVRCGGVGGGSGVRVGGRARGGCGAARGASRSACAEDRIGGVGGGCRRRVRIGGRAWRTDGCALLLLAPPNAERVGPAERTPRGRRPVILRPYGCGVREVGQRRGPCRAG
ncbi:hypothetical protein C8J57DRAFT_1329736 [Mycena rebaudengoi]|nr:hypothetical protein C8J57DRAFT_1329736 [Mycena rebaudengoi]